METDLSAKFMRLPIVSPPPYNEGEEQDPPQYYYIVRPQSLPPYEDSETEVLPSRASNVEFVLQAVPLPAWEGTTIAVANREVTPVSPPVTNVGLEGAPQSVLEVEECVAGGIDLVEEILEMLTACLIKLVECVIRNR